MGKRRSYRRPDYRLAQMQFAIEGEAIVRDKAGKSIKRLVIRREEPNPDDFGMVQIAHETEPLTVYQRFVLWQREKALMRSVYRTGLGVIRPVYPH